MRKELPLHDAHFDGIVMSGQTASLYFTGVDGRSSTVELVDVRELQMDDFQQGNIVILFEITTGDPIQSVANLPRLFPPPHPAASEHYHAKHAEFVRSRLSEVESGSLTFVELQPAIGADLLAICGAVNFKQAGESSAQAVP